jgi:hypothetical protein
MFPKLPKGEWLKQKQALHTTPVQKFGRTNHMIPNVIFGHWDVLSTNWLHLVLPSKLVISNNSTLKYKEEFFKEFQHSTLKISQK